MKHATGPADSQESADGFDGQAAGSSNSSVVPAKRAMAVAPRFGRRMRVGLALGLATLTLGSVAAYGVVNSSVSRSTTTSEGTPAARPSALSSRNVDQVNRSQRRGPLSAGNDPTVSARVIGLDSPAQLADEQESLAAAAQQRLDQHEAAQKVVAQKVAAQKVAAQKAAAQKAATDKAAARKRAAEQFPTTLGEVVGTRYATSALNLRSTPASDSSVITVVDQGRALKVTDAIYGDFRQVSWNGRVVWVSKAYLSTKQPVVSSSSSSSTSSGSGSSVSSGSTSGTCSKAMPSGVRAISRAAALEACQRFPAITSFGGYRAGDSGEHGAGLAVDMMISGDAGWAVANWARANASRLGITEVIYQQRIWTTQRSSEGWRPMSDRGSATANHYDHVHITLAG